jgi:hypothetical protein
MIKVKLKLELLVTAVAEKRSAEEELESLRKQRAAEEEQRAAEEELARRRLRDLNELVDKALISYGVSKQAEATASRNLYAALDSKGAVTKASPKPTPSS